MWKDEWKPLLVLGAVFLLLYNLPVGSARFDSSLFEALELVKWYAREHVLLCLVPAFFIAGGISVFLSQESVIKYLGAGANRYLAYGVSSVSGTILAVCSCTVLPLFAGIYRRGAGIGPASAFLYSGPAINILAVIMTARVLGFELGAARAVGAILFSIAIGLSMSLIFRKEEKQQAAKSVAAGDSEQGRPLKQTAIFFFLMILILVAANFSPADETGVVWSFLYSYKWIITSAAAAAFAVVLVLWYGLSPFKVALASMPPLVLGVIFPEEPLFAFTSAVLGLSVIISTDKAEAGEWFGSSWGFAKQIIPLLFAGVFVAGILLGRPGNEGLIPSDWINAAVGGNSIMSNLFASVSGAFMYFATLTEIPIMQGLIGSGMGKGPALALLLAGPALSLPSMLVLKGIMGTKKTVVYLILVIVFSTVTGWIYGSLF